MTGEELFLRYAYPCTQFPRQGPKISDEHRDQMTRALNGQQPIDRQILALNFSQAFEEMRLHAQRSGHDVWMIENVRSWWRQHRGSSSACSVILARVVNSTRTSTKHGTAYCVQPQEDKIVVMYNFYQLPLETDDYVFCHLGFIIEKA